MSFLQWFSGVTPAAIVGETASQTVGGLFTGITNIIKEFHLSPEQELQMKIAVEQQRLEFYRAQTSDVQSARAMQTATRSIWPGLLSSIMLLGFFACGAYILTYGLPASLDAESRLILTLFAETLISGVTLVLGYWLGSSNSSNQKNAMLLSATAPTSPLVRS